MLSLRRLSSTNCGSSNGLSFGDIVAFVLNCDMACVICRGSTVGVGSLVMRRPSTTFSMQIDRAVWPAGAFLLDTW